MNGNAFFRGLAAIICLLAVTIAGGCSGVAGGIVQAGVSGSVLGASMGQGWMFDESPKELPLECEGEQMVLEVSPQYASLSAGEDTVRLDRVYYFDKELRYGHVFRVAGNDQDLTVNEKQGEQYAFDWLVLVRPESVSLERDGVALSCEIQNW